ncbi:hypothetical protein [Modestobacter italicus]|uniref:hypothetical protein n=1 Tax=Modestobacter italicus (strain DSM 44449 / CECT 9708 / BC 501) TaxID=2732864 RepID=UPI001C97CDBA|nr:hypothetical protein [Modestobacter italicus]
MRSSYKAACLVACTLTLASAAACSSSSTEEQPPSDAERLAAAATAAPGEYGSPVDPSLPAPTDVATDAPLVGTVAEGTVVVSSALWNGATAAVEVDGLVPDVIESSGTCTLTLSGDGTSVTTERPGTPDATSTACASLSIPGADLSPGTWTAVLSYESPVSTAASSPVEVEIP